MLLDGSDQMLPRNVWALGRITATFEDGKGNVRVVEVRTKKDGGNHCAVIKRPVTKTILLKTVEELNGIE